MVEVLGWALIFIVTSFCIFVSAAYFYSRYVFGYFKRRKIPYEPPTFPFGNLTALATLKQSYSQVLGNIYKKHKGKKFVGFFQFFQSSVLIIDRDLIKQVLVKDFEHFNDKNIYYDRDVEPLSAHLFAVGGSEWKFLRVKMSPAFTSGKLKFMFPLIADVAGQFNKYMMKLTNENDVVNCKDPFIRYGIAIVANTAFGLDSDVFENKSSKFFRVCENIMAATVNGLFRNALWFFGMSIAKALKVRVIPKETHEFIMKLINDVVLYRETSDKQRSDFLQIMIELKNGVNEKNKEPQITMDELAAQAYAFILAGFEPVSNTMIYFLYEMAMNPEIQRRVQAEIDGCGLITYDSIHSMEYFDMVLDETLRKHTSLAFIGRMCSKDYTVPGTDDVIEEGTHVLVSTYGLHFDPDLFPDPDQFIPERFSKEKKSDIKTFSYLPFGGGPRICIGMRFSKIVMKVGLAMLLRSFRVERTPQTPSFPFKYDVLAITTMVQGGIFLRLVPRTSAERV